MSAALSDVYAYIGVFSFFFILLYYLIRIATKNIEKEFPLPKQDDFLKSYGYSYDFVIVYHVHQEDEAKFTPIQMRYSLRNVIDRLLEAKLECSYFYSCQRDEIYIKIRANPDKLKAEAARTNYRLQLDPQRLRARTQAGLKSKDGKWIWKDFVLEDDLGLSQYRPYDYIYCQYDARPDIQPVYKTYNINNHKHIFKPLDRIQLILSILTAKPKDSGAGLNLTELLHSKVILAAMPLHDYDDLKALQKKWLKLFAYPWDQPVDDIKDYFGERIGLYFLYLQHYVTLLIVPATFGLITYIDRVVENNPESTLQPYFTAFMIIWSTFYIEIWKRRQSTIAMKWGVVGFEEDEQDRPQYQGVSAVSPVDGSQITYFPESEKNARTLRVNILITIMLFGVLCIVGGIFYFKFYIRNHVIVIGGIDATNLLIGIFNAVVITILNTVYINIAIALNDYENFRTDTIYEDELIIKMFVFQTFNSFAALTYVSFIQRYLGIFCTNNNCILEASTTLSTVFLSSLISRSILEVVVKKALQDSKRRRETTGLLPGAKATPIEEQYILAEYDLLRGTMKDYAGLVIQFGFTVLFVGAFPLAPTLGMISGYIQIRIDGWKLCQAHRRPIPKIAEDIGTWQYMIEVLGIIGVIYNFGLICFTSSYLDNIRWEQRWLIFLTIEHVTLVLKYILGQVIDDVPVDVVIQTERSEFLVSKVLYNSSDDNPDFDFKNNQATNIIIEETDTDWNDPVYEEVGTDDVELIEKK